MVARAKKNLRAAGARSRVRTVVADAGYWSKENVAPRLASRRSSRRARPTTSTSSSVARLNVSFEVLYAWNEATSRSLMQQQSWGWVDPASISCCWLDVEVASHSRGLDGSPSLRRHVGDGSTRNDVRRSSRCSDRPNTTAASALRPPRPGRGRSANGSSSPPHTTSSNYFVTHNPTRLNPPRRVPRPRCQLDQPATNVGATAPPLA